MNTTVEPTPCVGKWELFDSTHPADHNEARQYCLACPLLEKCRADLRTATSSAYSVAYGPCGTWAGELVGRNVRSARQIAAEDSLFTEADARAAHAAWTRGERSDWAVRGERTYQRRRVRTNRGAAA